MQFFLTSPIIIFALWKHRTVGVALLTTLLVHQTAKKNKDTTDQSIKQVTFTVIPTVLGFTNDWGFSSQVILEPNNKKPSYWMPNAPNMMLLKVFIF